MVLILANIKLHILKNRTEKLYFMHPEHLAVSTECDIMYTLHMCII